MLNWTTKYSPGENGYVKIDNSYEVVNPEG
jgi:hypothetical protein